MRWSILICIALSSGMAELPRDPNGTLQRVNGGRISVGLVENAPWAFRSGNEPAGIEVALVQQLARELNATPEWHWGGEQAHMEALEHYKIDIVIGGLTKHTPWKSHVGLTDTYFEDHVMATAPGENGWIKRLDEFLMRNAADVPRLIQQYPQR